MLRTQEADAIVVNTCGFVEEAKAESIDAILAAAQLKADAGGEGKRLIVTGCLAQRYGKDLAEEFPEADLVSNPPAGGPRGPFPSLCFPPGGWLVGGWEPALPC